MANNFQINIHGYYTYGSWEMLVDDGQTELQLTVDAKTGVLYGGGCDNPGRFTVTGILVDDELRFIKSYRGNTSASWKYVGKLLPSAENNGIRRFAGGWGSPYGRRNDANTENGLAADLSESLTPSSEIHTSAAEEVSTRIKAAVKRAALLPISHNKISQNLIYTLETSFQFV